MKIFLMIMLVAGGYLVLRTVAIETHPATVCNYYISEAELAPNISIVKSRIKVAADECYKANQSNTSENLQAIGELTDLTKIKEELAKQKIKL